MEECTGLEAMMNLIERLFLSNTLFNFHCVFWGVSMDPERINHIPICWNLAGNQIGQNYDGLLN